MFIILGFFIGCIASIPIGPLNLFAITQVMKRDFLHGYLVGLTAAVLDTVYCYMALLGMSHLTGNVNFLSPYLKGIAVIVLFGIGIRMLIQAKNFEKIRTRTSTKAVHRPILTAFLLYTTNPALYAFWFAVAGTITAHHLIRYPVWQAPFFALSVGTGAAAWYFLLTKHVAKYHHQFKTSTFKKIFYVIALVLFCFAFYTLVTLY